MARLKCKKCKSTNIQVIGTDLNVKSQKTKTSLNLNPLKPLTLFNHKTETKKKESRLKKSLSRSTLGASRLFTDGVKDNRKNEYLCSNCGYRWIGK